MIALMLHDDWEINGDGTGVPGDLMFEPAREILSICDRFGARYTFFAEVMQQFAMLDSTDPQQRAWAIEWEDLLKDAVQRGHDVQLHIHPQWLGAALQDGRWQLDYSKWSTAGLSEEEIFALVQRGKRYLENLLQPVCLDYRLVAFRAGGWMAQPSGALIRALRRAGIVADCSVVPGKHAHYADGWTTDYRNVPSRMLPWWVSEEDVARSGSPASGVIELPSYAEEFQVPLPLHLLSGNLRSALHYWRIYRGKLDKRKVREFAPRRRSPKGSRPALLQRVFASRSTYCSFGYMHHRSLMRMVHNAIDHAAKLGIADAPLVMLTHSKSFLSFSNFESLLQQLSHQPGIRFSRTRDYVARLAGGELRRLPLSAESYVPPTRLDIRADES